MQVLILNYNIKTKNNIDTLPNTDIFFINNQSELSMREFEWIDLSSFEKNLQDLQSFSIKNKNTISLKIIVRRNDEKFINYIVKNKKIEQHECDINIMQKNPKTDKKKTLNFDEQLSLFEEYYKIHHKIPEPNEIYKSFKVGVFYMKIINMEENVKVIKNILNEE